MSSDRQDRPSVVRRTVAAGGLTAGGLTAATVLIGALLLGAGAGTTAALWHDEAVVTGQIGTGRVAFGVGDPDGPLTWADQGDTSLQLPLDPEHARVLDPVAGVGRVAVPIRVDSLSQGNRGLRYTVIPPAFAPETVFGAADTAIFKVEDPATCAPGATPPETVKHTSSPVRAQYSSGDAPTTEHWCLVATLDAYPDEGSYTNTATVTADSDGGPVQARAAWHADVTTAVDPAEEPAHVLTFEFETFRPGGGEDVAGAS